MSFTQFPLVLTVTYHSQMVKTGTLTRLLSTDCVQSSPFFPLFFPLLLMDAIQDPTVYDVISLVSYNLVTISQFFLGFNHL